MTNSDIVLLGDTGARHKGVRIIRALGTLALVVLALLGVRSIFVSPHSVVQPQSGVELPVSVGVDTAAAGSVATAIARSYLTLDKPDVRSERLSQYWANPQQAGWDGQGSVSVAGNTYVVSTTVIDPARVDVLVALYVDVDAGAGLGGWIGVKVPLTMNGGAPSAAGTPAIVGLPTPTPPPDAPHTEVDGELTTATRADIDAFFAAWASGDVSAVAAPGAHINAPRRIGALNVVDWRVHTGDQNTRSGVARVSWALNGATLTHEYTLTLAHVQAPGGSKWLVQDIH